jgi:hypothetical protein
VAVIVLGPTLNFKFSAPNRIESYESGRLLFPSKLSGPDLWYSDPIKARNTAWQSSKCEKKVYTKTRFFEAAQSIHPRYMFQSATSSERLFWSENWKSSLFKEGRTYQRITFSASGFNVQVHYLVAEYNELFSCNPIVLHSLATLQRILPLCLVEYLKTELTIDAIADDVRPTMLQREWESKKPTEKANYSLQQLKQFCTERDINVTDGKPKKKEQLIAELNAYNVEKNISDLIINHTE